VRLFSNHVVLPKGDGSLSVESAVVEVSGHSIVDVRPGVPKPGEEVQDFGDKLIAPAFVNAHTHLALSSLRGLGGLNAYRGNVVEEFYFKIEALMSPDDVRAFVRVAATECLLSGTAVVWDHYYHTESVIGGLRDVGLSGVFAPTLQDRSGPGVAKCEEQIAATLAVAADSTLAEEGIVAALGPHATDTVSDALWERVATLAQDHHLPVHAHVAQSVEEFDRSMESYGETPLARLRRLGLLGGDHNFLLVHGLYVNQEDLNQLDPLRHVLGYCPYSQLQFAFPAPVQAWRSAGVKVALGTDAGCCNDTMNVQQELRSLASGRAFAISESEPYRSFLHSPTREHAKAVRAHRQDSYERTAPQATPDRMLPAVWTTAGHLHPTLKTGEIRTGQRANLLIVDLDHPSLWPACDPLRSLALSEVGPAIHALVVNGSWRGTPGDFHRSLLATTDHRAAVQEANQRLDSLLARSGFDGGRR
jgi:5-methylthioadenosine/S-adenosylhomocysteine deaminase